MHLTRGTAAIGLLCCAGFCAAADISFPQQSKTIERPDNVESVYYWKPTNLGDTAQLLTLFRRSTASLSEAREDVPLVSLLRDTLGDRNPENDRLTYIWLLTYSRPNIGQRLLSAVPFFYWRVGSGSKSPGSGDVPPLMDLTAPEHRVVSEIGRNILQWAMLDPMTTPVRASSRAYRTNHLDHERLHLEEAIGYLRRAPVSNDRFALTRAQLNTVIARLELRKRLLGGLVGRQEAARFGKAANFEQERIRSRNWELLRQCAEKTRLLFEPLNLAGSSGSFGQYAILWFPRGASFTPRGTSLKAVWKLLNIRNPWKDARVRTWSGKVYTRALDENGRLLPPGSAGDRQVELIPLGVYSLNYPRSPLLMVDFRDKLHIRRHEMLQRTINEITNGVIGVSHFTNWYYYVAADLYDFVASRRGHAMDQAERLDCYSEFRVEIALDHSLDPSLHKDIQRRIDSLALNPLEGAPGREMQNALARYSRLEAEANGDGGLVSRLNEKRRSELASFGESKPARFGYFLLHNASLHLYTHRAEKDPTNIERLDVQRRAEYQLTFLDSLVEAGTAPEVAYEPARVSDSIAELNGLIPELTSQGVRSHAKNTIEQLKNLSQDSTIQDDCSLVLATIELGGKKIKAASAPSVLRSPGAVALASHASEAAQ